MNTNGLVQSFLLTFVIYTLPIVMYRFLIAKKYIQPKKAKIITTTYGFVSYVIMYIVLNGVFNQGKAPGPAIFIWSVLNYTVLTAGIERSGKKSKSNPEVEATPSNNENSFDWNSTGKFSGKFLNGKPHGTGEFVFNSGDRYVGQWVNGEMTGKGEIYYTSGDRYSGDFVNGKRNGYGRYFYANGKFMEGHWDNNEYTTPFEGTKKLR